MTRATEIDEQAARWLIRLDAEGPKPSDAVRAQFETWVGADLRHRAAYLRLSAAWAKTDRLRTLASPSAGIDPDFLKRRAPRPYWLRPIPIGALAASLLFVSVTVWWQLQPVTMAYRTEIGGFSRVPLSDGSIVALNTDSEIRVRLSRSVRDVTLVRGEAIFDVAHDRQRPFDVHVQSAVVRAVGTSFDVRRREGRDVDVIVTEGRVAFDATGGMHSPGGTTQGSLFVAAGEAAMARGGRMEVRKIESAEAARRLAWEGGQISFQGESLAEAVQEFNRYSRRQLVFADPEIGQLRVGGSFKTSDIDSFAAALRVSFGLSVREEGGGTLVIRSSSSPQSPLSPGSIAK